MFVGITIKENEKDFYITKKLPELVIRRGASPLMLPGYNNEKYIKELSSILSGLILSGGGDVEPSLYGKENTHSKGINKERDLFEIKLIKALYLSKKPILAICRGMQILNVAFGGTLIQHIDGHYQKEKPNIPTHSVFIKKGTKLYEIIKETSLKVNSFHHQCVDKIPPLFNVSAVSDDGIIEGMEHVHHPFLIGIQFHAEYMHDKAPFNRLFDAFIESLK